MVRHDGHSRPVETRPAGRSAALSAWRNQVRIAAKNKRVGEGAGLAHRAGDDSQRYGAHWLQAPGRKVQRFR